jgi:hypothetical protein
VAGPDTKTRKALVKQGKAMPDTGQGTGGRFPIRNRSDLAKAIKAVGRASGGEEGRRKVRRYIMRRAKALNLTTMIPSSWQSDGSVKGN